MLLAGQRVEDGRALIDRGVAADATFPDGTAYLLSTSDRARNTRAAGYALLDAMRPRVRVERLEADEIRDRRDVMFYFTGLAAVAGLETLRFRPGAIADHLTSSGGVLTGHPQMSVLRWLEAGAAPRHRGGAQPSHLSPQFPYPPPRHPP